MKRLLSVLTAAVMTAACAANAFAFTDIPQTEDIVLMEKLGIISGYSDGTFKPEEYLTRAEAVKMITTAGGYRGEDYVLSRNDNADFTDVDKNHWAYNYIKKGVLDNIISGFGDGTFRPDENVTWEQAVKMLMCLTGYNTYSQSVGGYPDGYITYGKKTGLFKNIDKAESMIGKDITRGEMSELTARTLEVPLVVIKAWETQWNGEKTPYFVVKDGEGADYQNLLISSFYTYKVTAKADSVKDNKAVFEITEAVNFDDIEINAEDDPKTVSLNIGDNDKNIFEKGKKYNLYIKVNDSEKGDYDFVCGFESK